MTIDWWTLGLQTVNVLILVWLLSRFFWKPVAGVIAQRRAEAGRMLDEAQARLSEARASRDQAERARAGLGQEREALLAAAHAEADQARQAVLDAAARQAEAAQAAARAAIAAEKAQAEADWRTHASQLAVDIARRLAARLDGAAVQGAFLDWLLRDIRALPEDARAALAAEPLRLVGAEPLALAEQERVRALIGEAVGAAPSIEFAADPALLAGLELHGAHLTLSNSWRADLGQILEALADDPRR